MSGRDISADDERVIRIAAESLLGFIGAASAEAALTQLRQALGALPRFERALVRREFHVNHYDGEWIKARDLDARLARESKA